MQWIDGVQATVRNQNNSEIGSKQTQKNRVKSKEKHIRHLHGFSKMQDFDSEPNGR